MVRCIEDKVPSRMTKETILIGERTADGREVKNENFAMASFRPTT